jgi:hypothetical protein
MADMRDSIICFRIHISVVKELCVSILFIYLLCGLVVRVLGCRSRGPGSIPGATRFSEKPLRIIEELLEWKSSGSGLENRN